MCSVIPPIHTPSFFSSCCWCYLPAAAPCSYQLSNPRMCCRLSPSIPCGYCCCPPTVSQPVLQQPDVPLQASPSLLGSATAAATRDHQQGPASHSSNTCRVPQYGAAARLQRELCFICFGVLGSCSSTAMADMDTTSTQHVEVETHAHTRQHSSI